MARLLPLLCALALLLPAPARAGTLVLCADHRPPYSYGSTAQDNRQGVLVDIVRHVFTLAGYDVEFQERPFARALVETRTGACDAMLDAAPENAPDLVFPIEHLSRQKSCFYTGADATWTYAGPASLKDIRVGVVAGYTYFADFDFHLATNTAPKAVQPLEGSDALARNISKILKKRIDATLDDPNVMELLLEEKGLRGRLRRAGCAPDFQPRSIAFSPAHPAAPEFAHLFSKGIRELRESGRIARFYARYGIADR